MSHGLYMISVKTKQEVKWPILLEDGSQTMSSTHVIIIVMQILIKQVWGSPGIHFQKLSIDFTIVLAHGALFQ